MPIEVVDWSVGVGVDLGLSRPSRRTCVKVGYDVLFEAPKSYLIHIGIEHLFALP